MRVLIFLITYFVSFFSLAERKVASVPISLGIVAGDIVCKNPVGVTDKSACLELSWCAAAGVTGIESINQGVRAVGNYYLLSLSNNSSITQNITVTTQNLALSYNVSQPALESGVANKNIPISLFKDSEIKLALPPNGSGVVSLRIICGSGNVCKPYLSNSITGSDPKSFFDSASPFTCQELITQYRFLISVEEPKGAVQAVITTAGLRHSGIKEHHYNAPPTIPINGGNNF